MRLELHLPIHSDGQNAVELLSAESELSKGEIKRVMNKGAVWLERNHHPQRLRRASRPLKQGDTLHLYYDSEIMAQQPLPPRLDADEGAFSVWYKPYGMFSQGSRWGDHCTIHRWVEQPLQPQRPAIIVHRLDRATTGLILIAHTKQCARELGEMFQNRNIEKRYRALVEGAGDDLKAPITVSTEIDGRAATTHITPLESSVQQQTAVDVVIETGRKHQIRRHLAELGHPIVGDRPYGPSRQTVDLQLTAYSLTFTLGDEGLRYSYRLEDGELPQL